MGLGGADNRPERVSVALRRRIELAAVELGYAGPSALGTALRTGRAGAIGLYNPDPLGFLFEDPAAARFMAGLGSALQSHGTALLVLPTVRNAAASVPLATAAVDGFVIYSVPNDDARARAIVDRGAPTVVVDTELDGFDGLRIGIDDRAGGALAARHLVDLGHRSIAVLALELGPGHPAGPTHRQALERTAYDATRLRWLGVASVLDAEGLEPVALASSPSDVESARGQAQRMLGLPVPPTAILCLSDRLAIGAARAVEALGPSVPEDVSVTGFDDSPEAGLFSPGGLTTVRQPLFEKGELAAAAALGDVPALDAQGWHRLPASLVARGSTASPPGRKR